MTKKDKGRWRAEVRRLLCKSVYACVDESMFSTNQSAGDDDGATMIAYGESIVKEFKAAIRKIR
jgi:hypothetical protein